MSIPAFAGWLVAGSALSAMVLTLLSLQYARLRGLIDLPGQRRAHRLATPRGGGLAIALTALVALVLLTAMDVVAATFALPLIGALAAVAVIGFWDDHRPLPVLPRLLVHALASLAVAWTMLHSLPNTQALPAVLAAGLLLACLLNFWNFMDGINGLASVHALWVSAVLGIAMTSDGNVGGGLWALLLASATLGFVPFNLPNARIFLGDVGSGFLGLAIGSLMLWAWREGNLGLPALVLLPSAFLIDAGATLLLRMAAGRRWYTGHRSHLYQWLARQGHSHSRIVLMSLIWNLPTSALALYLGKREDAPAFALAIATCLMGLIGWWGMRRYLRQTARRIA